MDMIRVEVKVRFTFCIYYVSTKPTTFSSWVIVTLQKVVKQCSNIKIHRWSPLGLGISVRANAKVSVRARFYFRFRVYLLHLVRFYQAYYTHHIVRYCHITREDRSVASVPPV